VFLVVVTAGETKLKAEAITTAVMAIFLIAEIVGETRDEARLITTGEASTFVALDGSS
jgi:hypothetical protein